MEGAYKVNKSTRIVHCPGDVVAIAIRQPSRSDLIIRLLVLKTGLAAVNNIILAIFNEIDTAALVGTGQRWRRWRSLVHIPGAGGRSFAWDEALFVHPTEADILLKLPIGIVPGRKTYEIFVVGMIIL